jgi:hypothetical protein
LSNRLAISIRKGSSSELGFKRVSEAPLVENTEVDEASP